MRTVGGAIGALWGNGNPDRWFGAGVMFDLGWRAREIFLPVRYALR